TLAAGINLPARSVVLPTLMKGPKGKKQLLDPSTAHQIFGRAGRPQYDSQGFVFALAHEDDVRMERWREKYNRIPDDTGDPTLRRAKKQLKKKQPKRSPTEQYWTEAQFEKLRDAKPVSLASRGHFPWRLIAWILEFSPEVEKIRDVVRRRLMDGAAREAGLREILRMLLTLWNAGLIRLEPPPPGTPEPADRNDPTAAWECVPKTRLLEVRRANSPAESLINMAWYRTPDDLARKSGTSESDPGTIDSGTTTKTECTGSSGGTAISGKPDATAGPDAWDLLGELLDEESEDLHENQPATESTEEENREEDTGTVMETMVSDEENAENEEPAHSDKDISFADDEETREGVNEESADSSFSDERMANERVADGGTVESEPTDGEDEESVVEILWARRPDPKTEMSEGTGVGAKVTTPPDLEPASYEPRLAWASPSLSIFVEFRSINPLYGMFLLSHLGIADREERLQAIESVLEMPVTVARSLRVPRQDVLPPGPLATTRVNPLLLERGLALPEELVFTPREEDVPEESFRGFRSYEDRPRWVLSLAEKLQRLFEADYPGVHELSIVPVRVAGEVLEFRDFDQFIT
ncbi:MAG: hypothetical protein Q4C47_09380, partial [Planctomycetia bacterium]|nr:hypothetical protein [Planctomycetia bacterium]